MSGSVGLQGAVSKALALVEQSRKKIAHLVAERHAPIAITGRAFRLPGGIASPDALWELLARAGDTSEEVPSDRWNARALHSADGVRPGRSTTTRGGFVRGVREFDAAFFGISAREARELDPQQRLLLELTWEALEDAQLIPSSIRGTNVGVFVGICSGDYQSLAARGGLEQLSGYSGTGLTRAPAAGRLSYAFGLRGPSLAVDTACSASLVALHLAVQSLRRGECERALVAGVNLILEPSTHVAFSQAGMLSIDGRCKTFSDAADGYGRAEGIGVLVLERADILGRSGGTPLAWVVGSALNQDGPSGGLTVPNGPAQQDVIRAALVDAQLTIADIGFVEAHGTGTPLGDLIEVNALASVFGTGKRPQGPLLLGSIKANVGHMEAAAGIGGVLKVIEQLRRRSVPPHPQFGPLNARVAWAQLPIRVLERLIEWGEPGQPLHAGVSSFGFSGSNAHAILRAADPLPNADLSGFRPRVLALSARTAEALRRSCGLYEQQLADEALSLPTLCMLTQLGREALSERAVVIARDRGAARQALAAPDTLQRRVTEGPKTPSCGWLFTGQGSQRSRMGQELYESQPVFRRALDACAALVQELTSFDLLNVLFGSRDPERIHRTGCAQPALFSFQWALSELWQHWGIKPDAVLGHSIGELSAACVAGVFSVEDGLRLACARGALMQALPSGGKMLAVQADAASLAVELGEYPAQLAVAARNAPDQVVLSGEGAALERVAARLSKRRIAHSWLNVSHAFHSPLLNPMLDELERVASQLSYRPPRIPLVSGLTGDVAGSEVTSANYWRRQAASTVHFEGGLLALDKLGCRLFLELGPSPVLVDLARKSLRSPNIAWLASCQRGAELAQLELCLATLFVEGFAINWPAVHGASRAPRIEAAPKYQFDRRTYWFAQAADLPDRAEARIDHPLLGGWLQSAALGAVRVSESRLEIARQPYFDDHRVFGEPVFPATGLVELMLATARQAGLAEHELKELKIERPLGFDDDSARHVQVVLTPQGAATHCEVMASADSGEWVRLCHARFEPGHGGASAALTDVPVVTGGPVDVVQLRRTNLAKGLEHRDRFWALIDAQTGHDSGRPFAIGRLALAAALHDDAHTYDLHPVLLDGCFQVAMSLTLDEPALFLPVGFESLRVFRRGAKGGVCHVVARASNSEATRVFDLVLRDDEGAPIAEVRGVVARRTTRESLQRALRQHRRLPCHARSFELVASSAARVDWGQSFVVCAATGAARHALLESAAALRLSVRVQQPTADFGLVSSVPNTLVLLADSNDTDVASNLWRVTNALRSCRGGRLRVIAPLEDSVLADGLAALLASALRELELDVRLIRCDVNDSNAEAVWREVAMVDAAFEVELRAGERYEPRWRPFALASERRRGVLSAQASYLITGGVGALGLSIAERFVALGARSLVLAQRSAPGPEARAAIDAWRSNGVEVTIASVDVSRKPDIERLFQETLSGLPRLAGIVHAAGVLRDQLLESADRSAFDLVFGAKAGAALLLHERTRETPLDFFVVFSSLAAAFGSPGQTHYAAANAACDGLIRMRRRAGLCGLSIQWGPWAEIGMSAQLGPERTLRSERHGVRALSPARALDTFDALLLRDDLPPCLLIADVDWDTAAERFLAPSQQTQLGGLRKPVESQPVETSAALRALAAAPQSGRTAALRALVVEQLRRSLGTPESEPLSTDRSLPEVGLDSLGTVELSYRLARLLRVEIPQRPLSEEVTVDSFVALLLDLPIDWSGLGTEVSRGGAGASSVERAPPLTERPAQPVEARNDAAGEQCWRGHHLSLGGLRWGVKADGPPVLLLHGLRSHAGTWAPLAASLTRAGIKHLLAPDLRGHGRSGHGAPGHCLDPMDALRDFDAVFKLEVAAPVTLVAHSFGCSLACLYAALRPEHVRQLVLIEPVIPLLHAPKPIPALLRPTLELEQRRLEHPIFSNVEQAIDLVQREFPALDSDFCHHFARRALAPRDAGWVWTWDPALREFERGAAPFLEADTLRSWIERLAIPVHFIVATDSRFPTRSDAERLAQALKVSSVRSFPGSHQVHAECPEPIANTIAELLNPTPSVSAPTKKALVDDLRQ